MSIETPTLVTVNITYDRATGIVEVGGDGWEFGNGPDEALCDWLLKKAGRIVEAMANRAVQPQQQGAPPDAEKRAELLKSLRNGTAR